MLLLPELRVPFVNEVVADGFNDSVTCSDRKMELWERIHTAKLEEETRKDTRV
jgi:hypothetical protein